MATAAVLNFSSRRNSSILRTPLVLLVLLFSLSISRNRVVDAAKESYLLPGDVTPEHYRLDIVTYLDDDVTTGGNGENVEGGSKRNESFSFEGEVWILVKCISDTSTIVLHALDLDIDGSGVRVTPSAISESNGDPGNAEERDAKKLPEINPNTKSVRDADPEDGNTKNPEDGITGAKSRNTTFVDATRNRTATRDSSVPNKVTTQDDSNASIDTTHHKMSAAHQNPDTPSFDAAHREMDTTAHQNPPVEKSSSDNNMVVNAGYSDDLSTSIGGSTDNLSSNDFYTIELSEPLKAGHKYMINMRFRAELKEILAGYYRCSYEDAASRKKIWLSVTQFEPTDARRAFPCFDEPSMKARFQINLAHHTKYTALSNMPVVSTSQMSTRPGFVWDHFALSVPMSTYLVAYAVTDFGYEMATPINNTTHGSNNATATRFRTWAKKSALNQVSYANRIGPRILDYYTAYFGVGYPLPAMDMIAVPDFSAGAMENWGLVTYRESLLLYDESGGSSSSSRHSVASVIAHELAHQWFGNLVTMRWWRDLWLNEGFATFAATRAVHRAVAPEWNSEQETDAKTMLNVFRADALRSSHPVSVPIGHPSEIGQIFDSISYGKGCALLRMMDLFLGEAVFRTGVSNYLQEHKYGNAEQDDLWRALTAAALNSTASRGDGGGANPGITRGLPRGVTVKRIMDTWTTQTGYPLVTVVRDYDTGGATVTQERYLMDKKPTAKLQQRVTEPESDTTTSAARSQETNYTDLYRQIGDDNATLLVPSDERTVVNQRAPEPEVGGGLPEINTEPCWYVPLSYTTRSRMEFDRTEPEAWLTCDQKHDTPASGDGATVYYLETLDGAARDEWVLFNVRMAGLYRVNYDERNWRLLIESLHGTTATDHSRIDTMNRVQLIDDAMNLAWTGDLRYSTALRLLEYLEHEREYLPWNAALKNLARVKRVLQHQPEFYLFENYIADIVGPVYERLGRLNDLSAEAAATATATATGTGKSADSSESDNSNGNSTSSTAAAGNSDAPENRTNDSNRADSSSRLGRGGGGSAGAPSEAPPPPRLDRVKHQILVSSWACRYNVSDCRRSANDYFARWMAEKDPDTNNPVPKDLASTVYCTAIRDGDTADTTSTDSNRRWDFLWRRARNATAVAATERGGMLTALGCTRNAETAKRYLEWTLDKSLVRKQDAALIFGSVAKNADVYRIARKFLYDRIRDIHDYFGPKSGKLSRYIDAVAGQITTQEEYDELRRFTETNAALLLSAKLGVRQSLENVELQLAWQQRHLADVSNLLRKRNDDVMAKRQRQGAMRVGMGVKGGEKDSRDVGQRTSQRRQAEGATETRDTAAVNESERDKLMYDAYDPARRAMTSSDTRRKRRASLRRRKRTNYMRRSSI